MRVAALCLCAGAIEAADDRQIVFEIVEAHALPTAYVDRLLKGVVELVVEHQPQLLEHGLVLHQLAFVDEHQGILAGFEIFEAHFVQPVDESGRAR